MENTLLKKLQIKPSNRVSVINAPINFREIINIENDEITWLLDLSESFDALFIFAITKADLNHALTRLAREIGPKTVCWIFYPKSKTSLAADLNLMQSWEDLKTFQLTPCGSAAIDQIWTAIRIKPLSELKRSGLGNAEIQQGDYAEFIDIRNKIVTLPADAEAALSADPTALATFQKLAYSHKKEYVLWILSAKQEKTRIDRLHKMVEKLKLGKKNPSEK